MNDHHFQITYAGIVPVLGAYVEIGPAFRGGDPPPATKQFQAIWDTGATGSVITQAVIDALGLKPVGVVKTRHAQGETDAEVYLISLKFPDSIGFSALRATKGDLGTLFQVLIGMDVIAQGDFSVTSHSGKTVLNYRHPPQGLKALADAEFKLSQRSAKPVPNPAQPPAPPKPFAGTSRNAMCPCGSGKKYKRCCGA